MTRARKALVAFAYLLVALLVAAQVGVAALAMYVSHTHLQVIEVIGGSMEPLYHVGDALLVDTDTTNLRTGQIVTFRSGDNQLTTHRIVDIRNIAGQPYIKTKGDANATPDPDMTAVKAVIGTPVHHVTHGGEILSFLQSRNGRVATYGPLLLLIIVRQLTAARRKWREEDEAQQRQADTPDADALEEGPDETSHSSHDRQNS